MESNYALYIKEREGRETIEDERGFLTYLITNTQCYIVDVFVKKEFRNTKLSRELMEKAYEIGKQRGCTYALGSVCIGANGTENSLQWLISLGFKVSSTNGTMIYLTKDL